MPTVAQVSKLAMELSEKDRWRLTAKLLASLPPDAEDDDGLAEAERREAAWDKNPKLGITLEQLDAMIERRRK